MNLPAAYARCVPGRWLLGTRLIYQAVLSQVVRSDLVVLEHASKYLMSYPVLTMRRLGLKKVAFWGHGRALQKRSASLEERWKRMLLTQVDWWFAYTESVARYIREQGFDPDRITTVNNSVDTSSFRAAVASIAPEEVRAHRERLGIEPQARVAVFCGSLYKERRLPVLIETLGRVRSKVPNCHLIIVGGGPMRSVLEEAAQTRDWLHCTGPLFGKPKATIFRMADIWVSPGVVGLGVLDAFAAGVPVLATNQPYSPEFDYLDPRRNCLIADDSVDDLARLLVTALTDHALLESLQQGARVTASMFGIESMATRMEEGIIACLGG